MVYEEEGSGDVVACQQRQLLSGLIELYRNKQLVDVRLRAEDETFPCHRMILAASSPYFKSVICLCVPLIEFTSPLLPLASEGNGKVMFSVVCHFVHWDGVLHYTMMHQASPIS